MLAHPKKSNILVLGTHKGDVIVYDIDVTAKTSAKKFFCKYNTLFSLSKIVYIDWISCKVKDEMKLVKLQDAGFLLG